MFDIQDISVETVTPVSGVEWRRLDALDASMSRLEGWED